MTLPRYFFAALVLLAPVSPCAAQNRSDARLNAQAYGRGTETFRRLLFELKFQPVPSFAELLEKPSESLFILFGNPRCLVPRNFPDGLRDFVKRGGAVLIATDMRTDGDAGKMLTELSGVEVMGETLVIRWLAKEDGTISRYDNSEYCPFVEPIDDWTPTNGGMGILGTLASLLGSGDRPDLFRREPQPSSPRLHVATNAPSYLWVTNERLAGRIHWLARLPKTCVHEKTRIPIQNFVDENGPLFAVGGTVGKGRVLVLADHSIFINRMMLPREINNLEFAANCLHWLRGGVTSPMEAMQAATNPSPDKLQKLMGSRNRVLFWDDGTVRPDFYVPLRKVPGPPGLPPEPAIVAAIDKTIAKLEDEDYFDKQLLANIEELQGGLPRVVRYTVYLLTLAALVLLGYLFLWRTRHRPETAVPFLTDAITKHEPRGSLLDQRRRALVRMGNVWEMGRRLARECFESAGVALTGTSPPIVMMSRGSWRQRWRVRRRVARLWRLACRDAPVLLSPAALRHRLREMEELKTALADGTIRLMISD